VRRGRLERGCPYASVYISSMCVSVHLAVAHVLATTTLHQAAGSDDEGEGQSDDEGGNTHVLAQARLLSKWSVAGLRVRARVGVNEARTVKRTLSVNKPTPLPWFTTTINTDNTIFALAHSRVRTHARTIEGMGATVELARPSRRTPRLASPYCRSSKARFSMFASV
jgi:hypothetical protein